MQWPEDVFALLRVCVAQREYIRLLLRACRVQRFAGEIKKGKVRGRECEA